MGKMNLVGSRLQRKHRLEKEKRAIHDILYRQLQNTDGQSEISQKINRLKAPEDNALFASWDLTLRNHVDN